jgi:hypothetical protein
MDWDNLGFALTQTDYMYMMKCSRDENFTHSPSAGVLNYGQVGASFNMQTHTVIPIHKYKEALSDWYIFHIFF